MAYAIRGILTYNELATAYDINLLNMMFNVVLGKSGFCVRILNKKTVKKALIKGFTGSIEDLSFAYYNSDHLACIDSAGDVFIWQISEDNDKIKYPLEMGQMYFSMMVAKSTRTS
jgi:WD40 repeat protein